jgi:small subunit ribosomal protein S9
LKGFNGMAQEKTSRSVANTSLAHGVGRRKKSVARVWCRPGKGSIRVNNLDIAQYFDTAIDANTAATPLRVVPIGSQYDMKITVTGGGKTAQADAVKLAIARCFVQLDEASKPALREKGLLTVDARNKERKKPGQKAARRSFQFVKR